MSTLESFVTKLEALPPASILRVCDLILAESDDLDDLASDAEFNLNSIDQALIERLRRAISSAQLAQIPGGAA